MSSPVERNDNKGSENHVNQLPRTGFTKDPLADMPFLQGRISRRNLLQGAGVLVAAALTLRPDVARAQEQPFNYQFLWVDSEKDPAKREIYEKEVQKGDKMLSAYDETASRIGDPLLSVVRQFGDLDRTRTLNPGQKPERVFLLYLTPSYKTGEIPEHLRAEPVVYQLYVSEPLGIIAHQIFIHSLALDLDKNAPDKIDPLLAIAVTTERVNIVEKSLNQIFSPDMTPEERQAELKALKARSTDPAFYVQTGETAKPRVAKIYQQVYSSLAPLSISPSLTYPGPDLSEDKPPVALEDSSE